MRNEAELPEHIKQRYGVKNSSSSTRGLAVTMIVAASVAIVFAVLRARMDAVTSELTSFKVESPTSISVSWEVNRDANTVTYCAVRAQDDARTDVGYAIVTIPAGESRITFSYVLSTESTAVVAEILGCGYSSTLRVPPPQFPPGVQAPAQNPPGVAPNSN